MPAQPRPCRQRSTPPCCHSLVCPIRHSRPLMRPGSSCRTLPLRRCRCTRRSSLHAPRSGCQTCRGRYPQQRRPQPAAAAQRSRSPKQPASSRQSAAAVQPPAAAQPATRSCTCKAPRTRGVAAHGALGAGVVGELEHRALAVGAGGDGDDVLRVLNRHDDARRQLQLLVAAGGRRGSAGGGEGRREVWWRRCPAAGVAAGSGRHAVHPRSAAC